jgi:hypothetical protein
VSLHDIEGTLGGKRVVVPMDTVDDFAFLGLGVWGDGETWVLRSVRDFGSWRARGSSDDGFGMSRIDEGGGRIHERDGGGTKLCLGRDDLDGVAEDVDGRGGRGHVVVV